MIFLPFILSVALDMSLPEFQPEQDLSGNFVLGEYDVSEGEFEVTETEELPDGLTVEAPVEEYENLIDNEDLSSEYTLLTSDNNYLSLSLKRNSEIKIIDNLYYIKERSSYNYYIQYVLLSSGISYDIDSYGEVFIGDSVNYDSQVYLYTSNVIVPDHDIYIMQFHHTDYYMNISISDNSGGDVSGGDTSNNEPDNPSGSNFDDTALLEVLHDIQMQLRCILFVCIWKFILPLAMKIRDHVFDLKHE